MNFSIQDKIETYLSKCELDGSSHKLYLYIKSPETVFLTGHNAYCSNNYFKGYHDSELRDIIHFALRDSDIND